MLCFHSISTYGVSIQYLQSFVLYYLIDSDGTIDILIPYANGKMRRKRTISDEPQEEQEEQ
jgi:hypothetical protein